MNACRSRPYLNQGFRAASFIGVGGAAHYLPAVAATAAFPGHRDHVRRARAFTARSLTGWPVADDAVLLTSELAANAVVHSASGRPGGIFWVHVTAAPGQYVRIEVCDQGGTWAAHDHDDERPHGLDIVRQLAACFGVDGDAHSGRIVWARLDVPVSGAEDLAAGPAAWRAAVPGPADSGCAGPPYTADSQARCAEGQRG